MASPFDRCGVLDVTAGKARTERKKSERKLEFRGRLFMVVDPKGWAHSFTLPGGVPMPPEDVNKILEELGVDVRVDWQGRGYVLEDSPRAEE